MSAATFIAADWGTSHLRLALCDASGKVLETRDGPGAAVSRGRFAAEFDSATQGWRHAHGELPAVLAGMVGSTFGWQEAPYLSCPAALNGLALRSVSPRKHVWLVPGLHCSNPLGAPDVMRGEEIQLLGACRLDAALGSGQWLVCLPGTHTKWVWLDDGVVRQFLTVPTGELFDLLCEHSVLVRDAATPIEHRAADFERGLVEATRAPRAPLMHRLFQVRSRRIDGQLEARGAAAWMSGLLIGSDVDGALPLFAEKRELPVCLIGTPQLVECYAQALQRHGRPARRIDGAATAFAGLAQFYFDQQRAAA